MYRILSEIMGYQLVARDGSVGTCKDFLFDDRKWNVRHVVADTGGWLSGRKVLVSPQSILKIDWEERALSTRSTRAQIESAPEIREDAPVSERHGALDVLLATQGWSLQGYEAALLAKPLLPQGSHKGSARQATMETPGRPGDPHLRSAHEVKGYRMAAKDGDIGHIEDFVIDDEKWSIRYLVADTGNWIPGRKVILSPFWIQSVSWANRNVVVDLARSEIKAAPKFNPDEPVNREYERRLYDFYGRPHDWE